MARPQMLTVFCYDVSDNKRRRRVAKILESRMARVQRSVFEARLSSKETKRLSSEIEDVLGPGDSLRVYAIGANGLRRSQALGDGSAPIDDGADYWLV